MTTRICTILLSAAISVSFVLINAEKVFSQTVSNIKVDVVSVEPRTPFLNEHLSIYIDTRVNFKLVNTTNERLKLYGSDIDGVLQPVKYLLEFDKQSNEYLYPTRDNKPLDWEKVSLTYKKNRTLEPGESIEFVMEYASQTECGKHFKIAVYSKFGKSKEVKEIRSDDFFIGECKKKTSQ